MLILRYSDTGHYVEPSDKALVLACRAGDATAWELLVDRYQRLVYAIARHTGLEPEQAAVVFQLVFAALVEHLGQIEQPALGAWLVTTARHKAWRFRRRERMAHAASLDAPKLAEPLADLRPRIDSTPADILIDATTRCRAGRAVDRLAGLDRSTVTPPIGAGALIWLPPRAGSLKSASSAVASSWAFGIAFIDTPDALVALMLLR